MTRKTAIAVVLSIVISGLGQIYLGYVKRGIIILIAGFAIGFLAGFLLPFPLSLIAAVFWGWNIYDAYKLSKTPATAKA